MPFPNTRKALEDSGYKFNHTKRCEACNVSIEMWDTPKGNIMPLNFDNVEGNEVCEPHFATCKNPAQYSRRLRDAAEKKKAAGPILVDPEDA